VLQFGHVSRAATAIVLTAVLLVAGCGGKKHAASAPTGRSATTGATPAGRGPFDTCLAAPAQLVAKIRRGIVLDGGKLSHVQAVTAKAFPGMYFVSARVDGGGVTDEVATWATPKLQGTGPIYAIDTSAALISSFGPGVGKSLHLKADAPGVQKSRVCAVGPKAPPGVTAPISGGGAPSSG
jgi:hypothetical protein